MSANKQTRNPRSRKPHSDFQRLSRRFMSSLLRSLFLINKPTRAGQAGFVLPTTVLLLLVVTLTAAALSFRSFSRTQAVIAQREQEVIMGAATPAIDRAKAKIEYLFARDVRVPGGLPTSNKLQAMMMNVSNTEAGGSANSPLPGTPTGVDPQDVPPYTLPDETRLDLNGDTILDNAWSFKTDIDGDGTADDNELIVYSVIMDDAQEDTTGTTPVTKDIDDAVSTSKAQALVSRNASIDTATQGNECPRVGPPETIAQRDTNNPGWEQLDNVTLLKNFQIDAFVINDNAANRTVNTLEFQQVRQAIKGNKWGAWFKNDIELFPDPGFAWNGAMHTEGSVFLGGGPRLKMISAYASCLYPDARASEITLAVNPDTNFEGQVVTGIIGNGSLTGTGVRGSASVDWFDTATAHGRTTLNNNASDDSINPLAGADSADVALDPIQMFTADVSVHRNRTTWQRAADWATSDIRTKGRITNQNENTPFLDDLYRADNRYGPKAAYTSNFALSDVNNGTGVSIGTDMRTGTIKGPPELADDENGLDGYWERQAIREGLRIIGGQRLELGNNTGWRGSFGTSDPTGPSDVRTLDPLYNEALSFNNNNGVGDKSMRLHRLSLRDNLAAVQSMAVYHAGAGDGTFPLMCMSMTSHPGTQGTKDRSTSFNSITPVGGSAQLDIDFFNGYGTNGWEYAPPLGSKATFKTQYDTASSSLRKALKNLAYFAGDPLGGAPSFTPVQDEHIHPYPTFSMWGDFSHLRHLVDAGAVPNLSTRAYDDLSPADQSYLHTAACTLGMLADNIKKVEDFTITDADMDALASAMDLITVPDVGDTTNPSNNQFILPTSPHAYIAALEAEAKKPSATSAQVRAGEIARIFHLKYQIARDRKYGFAQTPASGGYSYPVSSEVLLTTPLSLNRQRIPSGETVRLGIDTTVAPWSTFSDERKLLQLAALAGGLDLPTDAGRAPFTNAGQPKYPSLFYLFPSESHDHLGAGSTTQPKSEPYINDGIDADADSALDEYVKSKDRTLGSTYAYQSFNIDDIDLQRRDASATDWTSPYVTPSTTASNISPNIITVNGTPKAILLLDKGFMDGREMISSRTVDIDISLATDTTEKVATDTTTTPSTSITWIAPNTPNATGGIVYAFREDAKREDAIVRPKRAALGAVADAWTTCAANITAANCLMNFGFGAQFDPPLRRETGSGNNFISPKPVDYFADPMRRPYGFRLSNGSTLNRASTVSAGLSFITDNTVFIKGDFNLHQDSSGATQEEFTDSLTLDTTPNSGASTEGNFYTRTGRNTDYAAITVDQWRPVEIVSDAVGILSDSWNDGYIADTFTLPRSGSLAGGSSSYQNQLRPRGYNVPSGTGGTFLGLGPGVGQIRVANPSYFRENPYDGLNGSNSPVRVWRDGEFKGGRVRKKVTPLVEESIMQNLMTLNSANFNDIRKRDRFLAQETTVNALLVTGVVPSRRNQSNGGLHNLPRLLEHWRTGDAVSTSIGLNISGGLFQLNYSTSATGPWDQRADYWEPTTAATSSSPFSITYYGAPKRTWGYDVALQFAPAGPVSTRFITIGSPRSEYYREIPADDPYMANLQCARKKDGAGFSAVIANPTVTCPTP